MGHLRVRADRHAIGLLPPGQEDLANLIPSGFLPLPLLISSEETRVESVKGVGRIMAAIRFIERLEVGLLDALIQWIDARKQVDLGVSCGSGCHQRHPVAFIRFTAAERFTSRVSRRFDDTLRQWTPSTQPREVKRRRKLLSESPIAAAAKRTGYQSLLTAGTEILGVVAV